jgi:hypothetical protein
MFENLSCAWRRDPLYNNHLKELFESTSSRIIIGSLIVQRAKKEIPLTNTVGRILLQIEKNKGDQFNIRLTKWK